MTVRVSVTLYNSAGLFHCEQVWEDEHFRDVVSVLTPTEMAYLEWGISMKVKAGVYIRLNRKQVKNENR